MKQRILLAGIASLICGQAFAQSQPQTYGYDLPPLPQNQIFIGNANNVATVGNLVSDALQLPAGTVGQRPGTPVAGMLRFSNTLPGLEAYYGGAWNTLGSASGTVSTVSVVTANGVSGSVSNATTTPAITLTLAAITPSTVLATKAIVAGENTPTISTSTFATDASQGNHFRIALSSACPCTLSAPTNPVDGQKITYEIVQDVTGSRTIGTYATAFDFGTLGAPTLTTTASKRDVEGFIYSSDLAKWQYMGIGQGF